MARDGITVLSYFHQIAMAGAKPLGNGPLILTTEILGILPTRQL